MPPYVGFLVPEEGRRFALWLAFGTAVITIVSWLGVPLWRDAVTAISPGTTSEAATSGFWAFGLLLLEFVAVFGAVLLARRRGAPRWVWLPVAALALWIALAELVVYAVGLAGPAGAAPQGLPEVLTSLVIGISPVLVIALPALLACMRTGHEDEPLLGDYAEQPAIFAGAALVAAAVGVPWEGLSQSWLSAQLGAGIQIPGFLNLSGAIILWALVVPALACWLATARFHLPRAAWLPVAVGGLGGLLSALDPAVWIQGVDQGVQALVLGLALAILTAGGSILGAWLGTRGHEDSDMAGYVEG